LFYARTRINIARGKSQVLDTVVQSVRANLKRFTIANR